MPTNYNRQAVWRWSVWLAIVSAVWHLNYSNLLNIYILAWYTHPILLFMRLSESYYSLTATRTCVLFRWEMWSVRAHLLWYSLNGAMTIKVERWQRWWPSKRGENLSSTWKNVRKQTWAFAVSLYVHTYVEDVGIIPDTQTKEVNFNQWHFDGSSAGLVVKTLITWIRPRWSIGYRDW